MIDGFHERLVFEGDTVLNGQVYKKAQNRYVCANSAFADRFWAYFRTDATNSRLWIYSPQTGQETLVMDLNLAVGDVADLMVDGLPLSVVSVEQIDGRKVVNFWNDELASLPYGLQQFGSFRYIEGIGPTWIRGTSQTTTYDFPIGLSCIKQDGEIIFENSEMHQEFQYCADTCWVVIPIATKERQQSLPVSLFPNPSSDGFLNISSEAPLAQYSLYTLDGRLLQTATLRAEQEQLDLRAYTTGIHWLRIQDQQGRWALRKVFRQ